MQQPSKICGNAAQYQSFCLFSQWFKRPSAIFLSVPSLTPAYAWLETVVDNSVEYISLNIPTELQNCEKRTITSQERIIHQQINQMKLVCPWLFFSSFFSFLEIKCYVRMKSRMKSLPSSLGVSLRRKPGSCGVAGSAWVPASTTKCAFPLAKPELSRTLFTWRLPDAKCFQTPLPPMACRPQQLANFQIWFHTLSTHKGHGKNCQNGTISTSYKRGTICPNDDDKNDRNIW